MQLLGLLVKFAGLDMYLCNGDVRQNFLEERHTR